MTNDYIEKKIKAFGEYFFHMKPSEKQKKNGELGILNPHDFEQLESWLSSTLSDCIQEAQKQEIFECGNANPKGNVRLIFKGGCMKKVNLQDVYRCTGCKGWFHKECILKHFELEKEHDWGRKQERERIKEKIKNEMITNPDSILFSAGDDNFVIVDSFLKYLDSLK